MSAIFLLESGLVPMLGCYSTSVGNADVDIDKAISMLFNIKLSGMSLDSILIWNSGVTVATVVEVARYCDQKSSSRRGCILACVLPMVEMVGW